MDGDCNIGRSTSGRRTHKVSERPATSGNRQEDGVGSYGYSKPVKFGVRDCAVNQSEPGKVADGHHRSPMDNPRLHLLPSGQNFPVSKRADIASVARRLPVRNPAIDAHNKRVDQFALMIFNIFQDTGYKKHLIGKKYSLKEVRCALSRTEIGSGDTLDFITNNVLIQCIVGERPSKRSICKKAKSAPADDSAVMGNKPLMRPLAAGVKPEKSLADAGPGQASAVEQQIKIKSPVRRAGEAHAHKYPVYGGARPKPVHGTSPLVDSRVMKPQVLDFRQSEKQARPISKKINVEIIRHGLKGLGIANNKIDKIVNIDLSLMLIGDLYTNLEYDVDLTDDEILKVLRYLKGAHQVESWMAGRKIAMQRQQEERVREIELKAKAKEEKRKIEKFEYENDFSLARLFSLRSNIADPKFEVLAIGSRIDDITGMTFEKSKTVFADFCHADLNGDIHKTIDEVPPGKKFKEIHFTAIPGCVFNDASANLCLFGKINRMLEDGGKLYIKFGCSEHSYTSKSFADSVLAPSGFGQFVIPEGRQRSNAVFLSASKVHIIDEVSSAEKNEPSELTAAPAEYTP